MNRRTMLLAALLPLMMAGIALAQANSVYGFISNANNPHNFTNEGFSGGEICKPCHTPHNAIAQDISDRLWAHTLTNATYVTHDGSADAHDYLDHGSLLCMSCHDGTVALGDYVGSTNMGGKISSGANLGGANGDLTNDHPIGKGGFYSPTAVYLKPMNDAMIHGQPGKTVGKRDTAKETDVLPLVNMVVDDGSGGTVTKYAVGCMTCHTAHGTRLVRDGTTTQAPYPALLRMSNNGSQLCLTCHNK